ncbi:unnamed protein product [Ceutorhynchus assimilis]|uniref:Major facilitator superfamily (MFS) profile domain-containing protein n=1 Tax=Ceutorhynchus assimilis TaxID=467358 RepID=A0A9N9MIE6_9CUCU|nr:unnamed protein product [Ceutorhynchus assimilis]
MTNQNGVISELKRAQSSKWLKTRHIQMGLLFTCTMIMFSIRQVLSVAIVAMTSAGTSSNTNIPYYHWTNSSIVLSAFYWSYACLQFFSGKFINFFGTKMLLFVAMLTNALTMLLIPIIAAHLGSNGVMAMRIIQGLFQGFLLPCISGMMGRWIPPTELSISNAIVYSSVYIGLIIATIITGYLSASPWGWPASFYLFGVLAFAWCLFWWFYGAETPASHSKISMEERKYIEHSLSQQNDHLFDQKSIPWLEIFKSLPYWAIILASIGESWSSTFLSAELPSYLSYGVGLDIKNSSLFSSVPQIAGLIGSLCFGPIASLIAKKDWVSTGNSRRIFHSIGMMTPVALLALSYIENKTAIAAILITAYTANSAIICGHLVNPIDLSPRFASALSGISNGLGQLVAILAPLLVHFMVPDQTNKSEWRHTFILATCVVLSTGVFFLIFCSGERQPWDDFNTKSVEEARDEIYLPKIDGISNRAYQEEAK